MCPYMTGHEPTSYWSYSDSAGGMGGGELSLLLLEHDPFQTRPLASLAWAAWVLLCL